MSDLETAQSALLNGDTHGAIRALRDNADLQYKHYADQAVAGTEAYDAEKYGAAADSNLLGVAAAGFRNTAVYDGYRYVKDSMGLHKDPAFNPVKEWDSISKGVPMEYHADLLDAESRDEVKRIHQRVQDNATDMKLVSGSGTPGLIAYMAGGIIDVDLPLAFLSDGAYTAAKVGMVVKNARLASALSMGLSGAASGALVEGTRSLVNPTVDWTDVPQAAMMGMLTGTALGTALPSKMHMRAVVEKQLDDFHARMKDDPHLGDLPDPNLSTPDRHPYWKAEDKMREASDKLRETIAPEPKAKGVDTGVGAAVNPNRPPLREDFVDDKQGTIIEHARTWIDDTKLKLSELRDKGWLDTLETFTGRLTNDWYDLGNTKSAVAQWLRHRMLESPTGRAGRTVTASVEREMYNTRFLDGMPEYSNSYVKWAKETTRGDAGFIDMHWKDSMRAQFDREVTLEMNYRRLNDAESGKVHTRVKEAADALERQAKIVFDARKASGEDGFANIEYKRGYLPYRHDGSKMLNAMKNGVKKDDIIALYDKGYRDALGLPTDVTQAMAKAVVNRAQKGASDMDTSLFSLLTADGRAMLRESLITNGVAVKDAEDMVNMLGKRLEEKGTLGSAKARNELDLNTEHNGLRLLDFMDTNITRNLNLYARQSSGAVALARMGITNKAMRTEIRDALIAEQHNLGEKAMSGQFIDDLFSYFDAGPVHGGITPGMTVIKKATNLALLNKLGLAQAGELGATIASVGWENFLAHSSTAQKFIKGIQKGNTEGLLEDLAPWTGRIWDEHKLFDTSIDFSTERLMAHEEPTFMDGLTKYLNKGLRVQGYTSLFFQVREMQTKLAMASMTDKVMRMLKDGTHEIGERRLADMGLDKDLLKRIEKHVQDGTVEFMPNGHTDRLNMEKWAPEDAHDFAIALTRFNAQVIQKNLIGESSVWMHKAYGSILTHLQQFPMLALQKQTFRNLRIADGVTNATLAYGLATAGLAYVARQGVEGHTDKLDSKSIALGAIGMSNMTGWLPMLADTVGTMAGTDSIRMSNYGRPGAQFSPPVLDWLNRAVRAPGAAKNVLLGDADKGDVSALKALPFANFYGSSHFFDVLTNNN